MFISLRLKGWLCTALPVILLILPSCMRKVKNDDAVFKALDIALTGSNNTLNASTEEMYSLLEEKLFDLTIKKETEYWYPKAMLIKSNTENIIGYIETLKTSLKKEAGLTEGKERFREWDREAVNRFFNIKRKEQELNENISRYKKDLLSIDKRIDFAFREYLGMANDSSGIADLNRSNSPNSTFNNIPAIAALAMLTRFQNQVKQTENKTVNFCYEQCVFRDCTFELYSALAFLSSSNVRAGEIIEVTAGIGSFSKAAKPEIIVNGKHVPITESGAAIYRIKAPVKAGKYKLPVQISYTDQEGSKQLVSKDIEYAVTEGVKDN